MSLLKEQQEQNDDRSSYGKEHNLKFHIHRIIVFLLLSFGYAICLFLRSCPSIVADKMADDYNVDKSEIGIFTSIYYYTYAVIQPFVGLLVDVTEPGNIIGISLLVASLGDFGCGACKSMLAGCIWLWSSLCFIKQVFG